jgi:hypothetical protein
MAKNPKPKLKDQIGQLLELAHDELNDGKDKSNNAAFLYEIFFWQHIAEIAKIKLKQAWADAQGPSGPVFDDDELREMGKGEHIACESDQFSLLCNVQEPRQNFDLSSFKMQLCKKFKNVTMPELDKQAELAKIPTRAPLEKRVVEV